jgi:P-type Ca2+ transporter type 2C
LVEPCRITFWYVFSEEIREPLILLLLAIAVIYSLVGRLEDVVAIVLIVAAVVLVEVYTEYRAKSAVLAVKHYAPATAAVLRDGGISQEPTEEIVPGDILLLTAGERVPADTRLLEAYGFAADESHLTGESVAADKQASNEAGDEAMVFAGSLIVRGRGWGQVSATGMATKVGKVLGLVIEAKEPKTPDGAVQQSHPCTLASAGSYHRTPEQLPAAA